MGVVYAFCSLFYGRTCCCSSCFEITLVLFCLFLSYLGLSFKVNFFKATELRLFLSLQKEMLVSMRNNDCYWNQFVDSKIKLFFSKKKHFFLVLACFSFAFLMKKTENDIQYNLLPLLRSSGERKYSKEDESGSCSTKLSSDEHPLFFPRIEERRPFVFCYF